jgi:hypothetical protein
MTRDQKLALLNSAYFALLVVVLVLEQLGMLAGALPIMLLGLAGSSIGAMVLLGTKGVPEDERDRLYGNRSFMAAYFALLFCMFAGLFAAVLAFRDESIARGFLYVWVGGSWAVSMLVQSVATLVQYRKSS